jgi:hypothetical protein
MSLHSTNMHLEKQDIERLDVTATVAHRVVYNSVQIEIKN